MKILKLILTMKFWILKGGVLFLDFFFLASFRAS